MCQLPVTSKAQMCIVYTAVQLSCRLSKRILKCFIIKFEDRCLLLVRLHTHTIRFHVLGVSLDMYLNGVTVCVFAYHVQESCIRLYYHISISQCGGRYLSNQQHLTNWYILLGIPKYTIIFTKGIYCLFWNKESITVKLPFSKNTKGEYLMVICSSSCRQSALHDEKQLKLVANNSIYSHMTVHHSPFIQKRLKAGNQ